MRKKYVYIVQLRAAFSAQIYMILTQISQSAYSYNWSSKNFAIGAIEMASSEINKWLHLE